MSIFEKLIEDEAVRKEVEALHTSAITAEVDTQVGGLKSKNAQLLDEVKQSGKKFTKLKDTIGDMNIEEATAALALVNSEEGKLLKEGKKLEELVEVATSGMKADYESKLTEQTALNRENRDKKRKWRSKFQNKTIDDTLREAALAAKVRPEALQDIISRGHNVFAMSEDGKSVEARDHEGALVKIGDLIATPKNWVDSLKQVAPHYWPGSAGANLDGDGAGGGSDANAKMMDAAKRKDMNEYRKWKAIVDKESKG